MEGDGAAGHLAGLDHAVAHLHDVVGIDVPAGDARRGDEEVVRLSPADAGGAVGAAHEALVAGAAHNAAYLGAEGALVAGMADVHEVGVMRGDALLVLENLGVGEVARCAEGLGVEDGAGTELEGLEALVGIGDVVAHEDDAVVLHDDGLVVGVPFELAGNLLAQQLAARKGVRGKADGAAHGAGLGDDAGVGNLVDDAEGDEGWRMGVDDGAHLRTDAVEGAVEGILAGGAVTTHDGAVGLDAHDVGGGERALVDAGRGYPYVAGIVHDGEVTAAGGGHAATVDATDDEHQLLGRVHETGVKLFHCFLYLMSIHTGRWSEAEAEPPPSPPKGGVTILLPFAAPFPLGEGWGEALWHTM